jgi:hypothetical protein
VAALRRSLLRANYPESEPNRSSLIREARIYADQTWAKASDWLMISQPRRPAGARACPLRDRTKEPPRSGTGSKSSIPRQPTRGPPHPRSLIHIETWAGSSTRSTTVARSSRTEVGSTVSFSRAANAAMV